MGEWRRGPKVNSPSWFWSDNFVASINHLTRSPEMVGVTEFGYGMMSSSAHCLYFYLRHPTAAMATNETMRWKMNSTCKRIKIKFKYIEIDFCVPPDIPRRLIISHLFRPAPNGSSVFIEPDSDSVQRSRDPFQDSRTPDLTGRNQLSGNS